VFFGGGGAALLSTAWAARRIRAGCAAPSGWRRRICARPCCVYKPPPKNKQTPRSNKLASGRRDVHGTPVGLLRVQVVLSSHGKGNWFCMCVHGKKVAQVIRGWTCKHPCLLFRTSFGVSLDESKAIGALFHVCVYVLCAFSR
jgi:hypothetical protein